MPVEHAVESEICLDDVRVVAVDSRKERRQVMRQFLEHSFRAEEIAEADSRSAAIELVGRCQPDVVVVEIQMPLQEGLATITDLGQLSPRPRIVVCSFHHDAATVVAALERGADAYLAKPAGVVELRVALGAPLPDRVVRHRPPNERPVSPAPFRGRTPSFETGATT
jgi:DNA-binding NarL/FixJ family response regulator